MSEQSPPSESELDEAEKEIYTLIQELVELQNDLLELHEQAIHVQPTVWNLLSSRRQLTELQKEYEKLSEDVKLAIKVGHSPSEFE